MTTVREQAVIFSSASPDGGLLRLEGVLTLPVGTGPFPGVAIAHPHPLRGGNMDNNVVMALQQGALAAGLAVLRFNFRGVGRSQGAHGNGEDEQADVRAAVEFLSTQAEIDASRIALAGYSFGARVTLRTAGSIGGVKRVFVVAPPMRDAVLEPVPACPIEVMVGDRDQVTMGDLPAYQAALPAGVALQVVPGVDHFWWGSEYELTTAAAAFFALLTAAPPA